MADVGSIYISDYIPLKTIPSEPSYIFEASNTICESVGENHSDWSMLTLFTVFCGNFIDS